MAHQSGRSLEELAAFVAVVEANGFKAAAEATGARKATLVARIASLEGRLGVSLLARTTRSLRLTEEGRAFLEHAQRSVAAAADAERAVLSAKAAPTGLLRVTMPTSIADTLFDAVVLDFLARHPGVSIDLDTSVRQLDLVREGLDLAVRLGPLDDSRLVTRRLGFTSGGYFANPAYLQRRGTPERPEDLAKHDTIAIRRGEGPLQWTFVINGRPRSMIVRPRLLVNSFDLAARAAAAGFGLLASPLNFVANYLSTRQLVPVLRAYSPPGAEVQALVPPGGLLVPKTRIFVDLLVEWFAKHGSRRLGDRDPARGRR